MLRLRPPFIPSTATIHTTPSYSGRTTWLHHYYRRHCHYRIYRPPKLLGTIAYSLDERYNYPVLVVNNKIGLIHQDSVTKLSLASCARSFSHLASRKDSNSLSQALQAKPSAEQTQSFSRGITATGDVKSKNREQRKRDVQILKRLLPNIWPKDDMGTKARVLIALALLAGGKVA